MCGDGDCLLHHLTCEFKVEVVASHPSDWLIPSDDYVMLQQTKWEGGCTKYFEKLCLSGAKEA